MKLMKYFLGATICGLMLLNVGCGENEGTKEEVDSFKKANDEMMKNATPANVGGTAPGGAAPGGAAPAGGASK